MELYQVTVASQLLRLAGIKYNLKDENVDNPGQMRKKFNVYST